VSALDAEGLTARYPGQPASAPALFDLTLHVEPGERLLLVGPNGAGKSTFIRVLAGLMHASSGSVRILGQRPRSARHLVGVVSHATYLYDELTAAENLRLYAELYGVPEPTHRAATLLSRVGLAHLADQPAGRLSRGQQQRITIARALLHDPPVLLLDEPDTGLDVAAFGLLEELVNEPGRTVVMTTHDLSSGLRLGTRVGVLARGRLVHEQVGVASTDASALSEMLERLARA
jgi:ABC-type multidrug transport system ATPase subunit